MYDAARRMGYAFSTDTGGFYAGIKLLTNGTAVHYAIDNEPGGGGGVDIFTNGYSTALKYRLSVGQFRTAALWQFGGYGLNNAANGAYQFQIGADIPDVPGMVSLDGIYSHVKDAVAISLAGNTLPAVLPQVLTATLPLGCVVWHGSSRRSV